jgi:hypothetical protein
MSSGERGIRWIVLFAALKTIAQASLGSRYGFHRDELQFVADALHLDWGFVAYPPLTPLAGRLALELFGPSLAGLRLFGAIAQSAVIVLAAMMARTLGGGRASQWVSAIFVALAPVSLASSSLFEYVAFDLLWWVFLAWLVTETLTSEDPRWWTATGLVIGLGVETKYSIAMLVAGIVATTLASPILRRHLKTPWLWLGVALSIAVAAPNLLWQVRHDWISLEFLRSIHARDVRIGRTDHFLLEQLYVGASLFSVPLWIGGVVGLAASSRFRRFRPLLLLAGVPFVLFFAARGRGYYTAGIFPLLIAAGAVTLEPFAQRRPRIAFAIVTLLTLLSLTMVPFVVPVVPPGTRAFEMVARVNGDFAEEIGWPELVRETARVYHSLPPAERATTAIFCANYGEAGAIELFGPRYGLPRPVSPVNSFWLRGYGDPGRTTVIALGVSEDDLRASCTSVTRAGRVTNPFGIANEETREHPDIHLCRGLRLGWPQIWATSRSFG